MWQRLSDLSKASAILAFILYGFGFLTVNSFLAPFGMVSFDIINSRYLIAGIFPLMIFALMACLAWQLHKKAPLSEIFSYRKASSRFISYFNYLVFIYVLSGILTALLQFENGRPLTIILDAGVEPHRIRQFLGWLGFKSPAWTFCVSVSAYLFLRVVIPVLLVATVIIFLITRSKKNTHALETNPQPVDVVISSKKESMSSTYNKYVHIVIVGASSYAILFIGAIFLCAKNKLAKSWMGFDLLFANDGLSSNLMLAWIFNVFIECYLFIFFIKVIKEKFGSMHELVSDTYNISFLFYSLVIPILSSLFLFGRTIFPRIPYSIGGGEPREAILQMHTPVFNEASSAKTLFLGESDQYIYIARLEGKNYSAIQINKQNIISITTTKNQPNMTKSLL